MTASNGLKPETKTPAEVRAEIERARADIATSVTALRQEMAVRADWREWVRREPLLCVGGALVFGMVLGHRR